MAGAGYKLFNTGDVLTAAQVNTYLQEQTVMVFANATARTTALSGVLAEGMMSYLQDTNAVEVYDGSAWVSVGSTGDITGVTAGTGISGGGTSGTVTITNSMATAIDAKGDLIVGTGADTFARLAVGATNGHTLQIDSSTATGLKWAAAAGGSTFAGCLVYNSGSQTVNNTTQTTLNFDQEEFDTDGFHSTTTNTPRITIPAGKGGYYWVRAHYAPLDNATGVRFVYIYKNGNLYYEGGNVGWATYGGHADVAGIVPLAVGDYVEARVFQNSGGALGTNAANPYYTTFSAYYIGA